MKASLTFALSIALLAACSAPTSLDTAIEEISSFDTSAAGGGTSGTGPRSASITAATGDLLVAFASVSANSQAAPTLTDNNGGTYTLVGRAAWQATNNMFCFVRNSLLPNASATTLTLNTDTNTAGEIVIVAYTGMTRVGANAIKQFAFEANQPADATPAVTFTLPVTTGDSVIGSVASSDTATQEPDGWTERKDVHQATPTTALEVATKSKLTGSTITYGAFESFGYAVMGVELNTSSGSPPIDAGEVDAPIVADASAIDASLIDAATIVDAHLIVDAGAAPNDAVTTSFSHGAVSQIYGHGQNPAQITRDTASSGSTFLLMMGGGETSDILRGPTDNKGNTYTQVSTEHDYIDWPGSGTAIWAKVNATGGLSTTWSQYVTLFNEITVFEIEVLNAGAAPQISTAFNQQGNEGAYSPKKGTITLTSNSVTTTGPATLIALWWGAGPTSYGDHIATPNNGFTNLEDWSKDNLNGYVQGYMAYKTVDEAGTYNVTWTYQPIQGAELWLIAVQP